jgi:hypothetical protein
MFASFSDMYWVSTDSANKLQSSTLATKRIDLSHVDSLAGHGHGMVIFSPSVH